MCIKRCRQKHRHFHTRLPGAPPIQQSFHNAPLVIPSEIIATIYRPHTKYDGRCCFHRRVPLTLSTGGGGQRESGVTSGVGVTRMGVTTGDVTRGCVTTTEDHHPPHPQDTGNMGIWSMHGRYASYWNSCLFSVFHVYELFGVIVFLHVRGKVRIFLASYIDGLRVCTQYCMFAPPPPPAGLAPPPTGNNPSTTEPTGLALSPLPKKLLHPIKPLGHALPLRVKFFHFYVIFGKKSKIMPLPHLQENSRIRN